VFWKLFFCSFSSIFQIFLCEMFKRCFWLSVWCGCFVQTFLLLVRTGVLVRSLTWHYAQKTLMFHLDGGPCRVKSHSPSTPHDTLFFLFDFLSVYAFFFALFMCTSHVHLSFLQFLSTPSMFLYPFTVFFKYLYLK
jgi:hypothetical protein